MRTKQNNRRRPTTSNSNRGRNTNVSKVTTSNLPSTSTSSSSSRKRTRSSMGNQTADDFQKMMEETKALLVIEVENKNVLKEEKKELQEELKVVRAHSKTLSDQNSKLMKKVEDFTLIKAQNESLKKRLAKTVNVTELQGKLKEEKENNTKLKAESSQLKKDISNFEKRCTELEVDKKSLRKMLDTAQLEIELADENEKKRKHTLEVAKLKKETEEQKFASIAATIEAKEKSKIASEKATTAEINARKDHAGMVAESKVSLKMNNKKKKEMEAMQRLQQSRFNAGMMGAGMLGTLSNFPTPQMTQNWMGMMGGMIPHNPMMGGMMPNPMMNGMASNPMMNSMMPQNPMMPNGNIFESMHNGFKDRFKTETPSSTAMQDDQTTAWPSFDLTSNEDEK